MNIYFLFFTLFRIVKYYLFSNYKRYLNLLVAILFCKPKNILEIGVYNGKRANEMIDASKIFNNKINYYGFDLFEKLLNPISKFVIPFSD